MSDTALNYFLGYGNTASRPTPSPPTVASGPDLLYLYFDTDTGQLLRWNGAAYVDALGSGAQAWTADISPSQITSNQNDYNPTGLSTASTLRLSTDASRTVTGLAGGSDGRIIIIHNVGSQDLVLADESASSTAANRFAMDAVLTLAADTGAIFRYDSTSSRWRLIGKATAGGGGGIGGSTGGVDNAILRADGAGGSTLQSSALTIDDTGVITFPDNVRQTFNPGANAAGLNVGALAGDPDTPVDGDAWYNSSAGKFRGRENGATVDLRSGGLVLLEQHTASSSATLDFTTAISSTYDEYVIELVNVVPATDNIHLYMRMSTDGGSSYDSGANYGYVVGVYNRFGAAAIGANSGETQLQIGRDVSNSSNHGVSGHVRLFSPGSTSLYKSIRGETFVIDAGGNHTATTPAGQYRSTTAVNAFRFLFASGNIASGIIRVYGVVK